MKNSPFRAYRSRLQVEFRPTPPRGLSKNLLECNHAIIPTIFVRVRASDSATPPSLAAQQAIRSGNDLYGSTNLSALKLAHGHSRPVCGQPHAALQDVLYAQLTIAAMRKLVRILRSCSTHRLVVVPGDIVEIYVKRDNDKRGKWSSPPVFLKVHRSA